MWLSRLFFRLCECDGDMGVAVLLVRLAGVIWRTVRKPRSFSLILVLSFSLCLLRSSRNLENMKEQSKVEQEGEEGEFITAKDVHDTLTKLQDAVTTIESPCRKLALLGGVISCSCGKRCAMDGSKLVCLDPDVMPPPRSCIALNFGIGYDFSFDQALANYGCRVFALDPTNSNVTDRVYQANLTHSLPTSRPRGQGRSLAPPKGNIHALNIGLSDKDYALVLNLTGDGLRYRSNKATYLTYRSILRLLDNPRVDLLKIDIEGKEWDVFWEILSSRDAPKLLQHVRQILMEVHFDFLKPSMPADEVLDGAMRAFAVLRRLREFGFLLTAMELNDAAQTFLVIGPVKLALFREITLVRRGVRVF